MNETGFTVRLTRTHSPAARHMAERLYSIHDGGKPRGSAHGARVAAGGGGPLWRTLLAGNGR